MIIRFYKNTNLNDVKNIIDNINKEEVNEETLSNTIYGKIDNEDTQITNTENISNETENCIEEINNEDTIIEEEKIEIEKNQENTNIITDKVFYTQEEAINELTNYIAKEKIKFENCNEKQLNKIYLVKCIVKENINILKKEIDAKNRFDIIAKEIGVVSNLKYDINEEIGYFTQDSNFMKDILDRFKKQTSKSRTCDKCNSVLNKNYITTTYCPLCGSKTFLTTKTDIERAKTIKKKISTIQKEIKTIIDKREKKSDIENWEYLTII
jgi:uncharacterized Zn finger protein (UPF0148 family)